MIHIDTQPRGQTSSVSCTPTYPVWNQFWGLESSWPSALGQRLPLIRWTSWRFWRFWRFWRRFASAWRNCAAILAVHCRAMHKLRVHWPKAPLISWDYPDTLREYPRPKKRQHMQLLHAGVVRVSLKLQLIVLIFRLDFDKRPALKKVLPVALVHLKRAICSGQTDCLQG